jgi:hypothetical protein
MHLSAWLVLLSATASLCLAWPGPEMSGRHFGRSFYCTRDDGCKMGFPNKRRLERHECPVLPSDQALPS